MPSDSALGRGRPLAPPPWAERAGRLAPGLILAAVIATAARFAADHSGGPPMVYALALGLSLGVLADETRCRAGLEAAVRQVMHCAIVLMGLQLSLADLLALGPLPILAVVGCVMATAVLGLAIGRLMGLRTEAALLAACATAICGATAMMAIGSLLPRRPDTERLKGMIVATIMLFSTTAMIALPGVLRGLGLDDRGVGFVLGAVIADVAQVVSAGFSVSDEAGRVATLVKLVRVSCLLPAVVLVGLAYRRRIAGPDARRPTLVPGFMIGFVALAAVNSLGVVPHAVADGAVQASRWCMLAAVAALGVQTSMRDMATAGLRPFWALLLQAGLLLSLALAAVRLAG